jgi:protease-4
MSNEIDSVLPPASPQPQPTKSRSKSGRALLWIILIILGALVAPAVGCGAFGFAIVAASSQSTQTTGIGPAVGVIYVEGVIFSGESSPDVFGSSGAGSATIVELIQRANEDSDIKAIVLRVDSPGGGVVASDEIHHALLQVNKPVVVSMGSVAASGGYYISAPADYIYANPHTLTGSIGVISQFITAEELLDEIGVEVVVVTSGEVKDFGSYHRDMTDEERAYWQALIDETYDGFVQIVADGRGMSVEQVRQLADGRVYTGLQAVELGLIDEVGYFEDAINKAADLGGISGDPRVIELYPEYGFWDSLYGIQAAQNTSLSLDLLRDLMTPTLEARYLGQ